MLFKVGSKEAIGSSTNSTMLSPSVTMRVELGPGDYVLQVRHTVDMRSIMLIYTLHQVRLDREINGEEVRVLLALIGSPSPLLTPCVR